MRRSRSLVFLFLVFCLTTPRLEASAVFDAAGQRLEFAAPPVRVVSLMPSVTEVICFIGASDSLAGLTYHDSGFEGTAGKAIVGGAFTPQFKIINDLSPDLLIAAPRDFAAAKAGRGEKRYPILVVDDDVSLAEAEARIRMIGEIFGREAEAEGIIGGNREMMETIRLKTAKIPPERRRKAVCLSLGRDGLITPGKGSFQTEFITSAGGIAGDFGEGRMEGVSLEEWLEFDPDFAYVSDAEYESVRNFLDREGWRDASAVRNGRVLAFPQALVCRASAHVGYFVAWLSSELYADDFANLSNLVHPQEVISERAVSLDVPYVERARVVESRIMDFVSRTLLIDFKRPQRIVSTVRGERDGVETIGNAHSPVPTWSVYHKLGFDRSTEDLFRVLKLDGDKADVMLTGADMNNLAIKSARYRDMAVFALVTAGVEGNAIRTSKDVGAWYEPGTINIMVLTNHKLSEQAATRAIVTVTEAKTAALWDMDIRSVQTRLENPATGTGTDTVVIVSGEGAVLDGSGGHTKMGELIADAVYRGVQEALLKQNGKIPARSVFERLGERGLSPHDLFDAQEAGGRDFQRQFEELLMSPACAGFLEAAFSLSDALVMGQFRNVTPFDAWALEIAGDIAGRPVAEIKNLVSRDDLPPVLETALDAIATGIVSR